MKTLSLMKVSSSLGKALRYFSAAIVALSASTGLAGASVIHPLDQWSNEWTNVKAGGDTTLEIVDGALVISRPPPPQGGTINSTGAISFWNGSSTIPGILGDFSGSVVLNSTNRVSDAWGVVIGAQSTTFTTSKRTNYQGYYIALVPGEEGNSGLNIWYNHTIGDRPSNQDQLVHDRQPGALFSNGVDYLLEFSVSGPTISASLWNLSETGEKTGSVLAEVSYEADADITGYFGLKAFRLGNTASRSFSDLKLDVIPEPGSVALAAVAVLGCLLHRSFSSKKPR